MLVQIGKIAIESSAIIYIRRPEVGDCLYVLCRGMEGEVRIPEECVHAADGYEGVIRLINDANSTNLSFPAEPTGPVMRF
jgi:hypothetical protein